MTPEELRRVHEDIMAMSGMPIPQPPCPTVGVTGSPRRLELDALAVGMICVGQQKNGHRITRALVRDLKALDGERVPLDQDDPVKWLHQRIDDVLRAHGIDR